MNKELTYEKLLKCDGMKCSFETYGKKIVGFIDIHYEKEIHCTSLETGMTYILHDTSNRIDVKNLKLIEEKEEIMKNENILDSIKAEGKTHGGFPLAREDLTNTKTNSCVGLTAEDMGLNEEPAKNETIRVNKRVYDIMQKNSLDKIETQHENKMLKQEIAELKKAQSPKINPETGQYEEMPEAKGKYWTLCVESLETTNGDWDIDKKNFKIGNMFHTKESCEIFAKKFREILKGGV